MAAMHGEETINCTIAQKFALIQVNVQCVRKSKGN
jgi:hypothetical protein